MTVHNYFTVKQGGRQITAFNTAVWIGDVLAENRPYAGYIVLGYQGSFDSDKLLNIVYIAPTKRTDSNADAEKGPLRAEYSITVENVQQLTFDELTLSANSDGTRAASYARLPEPVVYDGEPITVTVTVFVELTGEVQMLGGSNPLARWLLGYGNFSGEFRLAVGQCNYPKLPLYRKREGIATEAVCTYSLTSNGLFFEAELTGEKNEFLVLLNNVPVLRARPAYTAESYTLTIAAKPFGGFLVGRLYPERVVNVTQNGTPITDFTVYPRPTALRNIRDLTPFRLGNVSALKNDPDEAYAAAINDSEVVVLQCTRTDATVVLRVPRRDEYVEVLSGGGVALWGQSSLCLYRRKDDGSTQTETYALEKGTMCAVVAEGAAIHAARLKDGYIERYRLQNGTVTLLERLAAGEKQVLCRNRRNILWFNGARGNATLAGSNAVLQSGLEKMVTVMGAETEYFAVSDYLAYGLDKSGRKLVYSTVGMASQYNVLTDAEQAIVGDRVFVKWSPSKLTMGIVDMSTGAVTALQGAQSAWKYKAVTIAGDWLLQLHENGELQAGYLDASQAVVYSPSIVPGQNVSYVVRARTVPYTAAAKTRVRMGINFA